jgi:hypothetical protein
MTENGRRLETAAISTLALSGLPTEEEITKLAEQLRRLPPYEVSDDEFSSVIGKLRESLRIDMGLGSVVVEDHTPWLAARKASIEFFYWQRYQLLLHQQSLGPRVVAAIDRVTDEVLDLLGNPVDTAGWPRRGLVMGDVQSGKTSNYTALIAKAADAGYRLIILLTGTLETLRRQTQGRLDAGFVGLDSAGVVTREQRRREVGVGLINAARTAGVFTSTLADFRAGLANQLGFRLESIREPILLVVKKNKSILQNLTNWLVTYNANAGGTIDVPMLLIDDEADNASINVNPDKATAINAAIRGLLKLFPRSSYVGFTATPFANIFVNPDTKEDMLGDDLFPRHFIYALESPTNYIGAQLLFGDDSPLNVLRKIEDAETYFPSGHKSDFRIAGLPGSLLDAVRAYMVANAIMDMRPGMPLHRSMLVNTSRYTAVQNQVRDELDLIVRQMQLDVRNYSGLSTEEAIRYPTIRSLHETWSKEFEKLGCAWPEVLAALNSAVQPIEVRAINQKTGAASLDYSVYGKTGLRVIAVGGNSLSRGLTLEGLCTSYFYRNTQMYDTLLQMGRWFGYRDGYLDLLRIWMSGEAIDWYGHIVDAAEELRREIRWMQQSNLKPIDFGLKVRAHPESLLITARNKMRHSKAVTRVISVSNRLIETPRLFSDAIRIEANYRVVSQFVERVASGSGRVTINRNPLWTGIARELIAELLDRFIGHPLNISFQPRDLAEFIRGARDDKLKTWDVVIPMGDGAIRRLSAGIEVKLEQRQFKLDEDSRSLLVSGSKMRVGSRGVEREGLNEPQRSDAEREFRDDPNYQSKKSIPDHFYRKQRTRPLLMLHFLEDSKGVLRTDVPICALGLSFPDLRISNEMVTYRVNLVELRNMLEADLTVEDEDDDGEEENADGVA